MNVLNWLNNSNNLMLQNMHTLLNVVNLMYAFIIWNLPVFNVMNLLDLVIFLNLFMVLNMLHSLKLMGLLNIQNRLNLLNALNAMILLNLLILWNLLNWLMLTKC